MRGLLIMIITLLSFPAAAVEQSDDLDRGISRLIHSVEQSDCQFIRNGKAYSPRESANHITRKYQHYKNKINSIERFIELAASKSVISGRPYQIVCVESDPISASSWMRIKTRELGLSLRRDSAR
ncbi:MAG: DUF5329 family protein [Pseudomonadales bacterium]